MHPVTLKEMSSSAISTIKCSDNGVIITYKSNTDKEYHYNCENVEEFAKNARKVVNNPEKSTGSWVNRQIKEKVLILNIDWSITLLMAKSYNKYDKFIDEDVADDAELFGYEVKNMRRQSKKKVRKFKDYDDYNDYNWTHRW